MSTLNLSIKNKTKSEIVFFLVSFLVICFCSYFILRHSGWPKNHDDGLIVRYRVAVYADHFRHGDLFPIWSSSDAGGFGSPTLLYYHKLFYYLAGFIYFLTSYLKLAIFTSLAIFMLVGVYGMRFCIQKFSSQKILLFLAPQFLILSNYAFTDWLYRGAFAEFTAMMLIPWLLWWCLKLLSDRVFSWTIVPIMFSLFYAHNIIGLCSLIPVISAYIIFVIIEDKGLQKTIKKAVISSLLLITLLLPWLLVEKLFLVDYNPSKITQLGFLATENFVPLWAMFLPGTVVIHGRPLPAIRIDLAIWLLLLTTFIALILGLVFWYEKCSSWLKRVFKGGLPTFFTVNTVVFMLLQLRFTTPLYKLVRPLQFLQFPWRLMAFIVPISILLAVFILNQSKSRALTKILIISMFCLFIACAPPWYGHKNGYITGQQFADYKLPDTQETPGFLMTGIGEYLPRVYEINNELGSYQTLNYYKELVKPKITDTNQYANCKVESPAKSSFDSLRLSFQISCNSASAVRLPISFNRYSTIINLDNGKPINYYRVMSDPRIIIDVPKVEKLRIDVTLPTFMKVIRTVL